MMRLFAALLLAIPTICVGQDTLSEPPGIERQEHDHTIYILSGDPDQLAKFHGKVGTDWEGGVLLEADKEGGVYRYWAYGWRTAAQSRNFIMPAVFSGLDLKFESYKDADAYPEIRRELDRASRDCGFSVDPFLILPSSEITLRMVPNEPLEHGECLLRWIRESEQLDGMAIGIVGSETKEDQTQ